MESIDYVNDGYGGERVTNSHEIVGTDYAYGRRSCGDYCLYRTDDVHMGWWEDNTSDHLIDAGEDELRSAIAALTVIDHAAAAWYTGELDTALAAE